jgi:hypothetical protein
MTGPSAHGHGTLTVQSENTLPRFDLNCLGPGRKKAWRVTARPGQDRVTARNGTTR